MGFPEVTAARVGLTGLFKTLVIWKRPSEIFAVPFFLFLFLDSLDWLP